MGLEPLLAVDLVRTEFRPDVVVEDFGCCARKGSQPGLLGTTQVVGQRLAEPIGALGDLQGGEAVYVDVRYRIADSARHVYVVVAVEIRMDPTL